MTELDRKLDKILRLYADRSTLASSGLAEDEFTGHFSAGMAREAIQKVIKQAQFKELTSIGVLLNGSRKKLIEHYEERYNYLKGKS